ncbi:MAG TPA: aquaporin [Myxococcales bacterium]
MIPPSLPRCAAAELIGTALLLAAVVGSGIMGERLAGGNVAIALLANSIAFLGVAVAHLMFGEPLFSASRHARAGGGQFLGEVVATFGLLAVIWGVSRRRAQSVPAAVAAYITAAYWFTSSTSFANPAVTLARAATDTFAGIRPADAPAFILAQLLGAAAATALFRWLAPALPVAESVVPREEEP